MMRTLGPRRTNVVNFVFFIIIIYNNNVKKNVIFYPNRFLVLFLLIELHIFSRQPFFGQWRSILGYEDRKFIRSPQT